MKSELRIKNFNAVIKYLEDIDLTNKKNLSETRKVVKKPFLQIAKGSRQNLKSQKSMQTGNLYSALSVGSSYKKSIGYLSVAFGARTKKTNRGSRKGFLNHFHLVNSGTKKRFTKKGRSRGAVGRAKSGDTRLNKLYKRGFSDKIIISILPTIKSIYIKGFDLIIKKYKT